MAGAQKSPLGPPRVDNLDPQAAVSTLLGWLNDFYNFFALQNQHSSDEAYSLANDANTIATAANNRTKYWLIGTVTFANAETSKTVNLTEDQPDADYKVFAQAISSTGTPAAGSQAVIGMAKTVGAFDVSIGAAPGVGNSVTFDLLLAR